MTRLKKKRSDANRIEWGESAPRRSEKLADPDSYESRKKRSLEKRKQQKSVSPISTSEKRFQRLGPAIFAFSTSG